jgi:hypothetical protein
MPKSKKKAKIRDKTPSKDPKGGGHHGKHHRAGKTTTGGTDPHDLPGPGGLYP